MQITLDVLFLNEIFKACRKIVRKDGVRPILEYVQLECENGSCRASATDIYKARQVDVPYEGDEGVLRIPIIKPPKCASIVIIDDSDKEITFDFLSEKQTFKKIEGVFPNVGAFMPKGEPVFKIAFRANQLKAMLEGFSGDDDIKMGFFGELSPCTIKVKNKTGILMTVPVKG